MAKPKTPSAYYVRDWYDKSDIDYFGAFVKVYIPFNAWMNEHFKGKGNGSDRAMLDGVKYDANTFRSKLETLLTLDDAEGRKLRGLVGMLHSALESSTIANNGEKITFESVVTGRNPNTVENREYHGVKYMAQYDVSHQTTQVEVTKKSNGQKLVDTTFTGYPAESTVQNQADVLKLNQSQRDYLTGVYRQVNPKMIESLLYKGTKKNEGIVCAGYRMISDTQKLSAGIIEIIYSLRCALFHGVIDPNRDANKVYGEAYQIMHLLVSALI